MKRRVFVFFCLLPTVLLLTDSLIEAQQKGKMRLIGYVSHRPGPSGGDRAFLQVLRNLGWIEGQNITIEYRWAARKWDRAYCAMYNLTQGRYVAPFVILTLQGLTLELKEGNNGRVHHGTTIQAGVFTIHL